jgi:endonuclease-8
MPEGDAVWAMARRLDQALADRRVTRCEFRVPKLATTDLTGSTITAVVSRGKHLLTRFDNNLTLHSHLRMDGTWRLFPDGSRWTGGPGHEIRAILGVDRQTAVGYRLPVLEIFPTAAEEDRLGYLGPDLLGEDWDVDEAVRRLENDPGRTVGEALLDQRNLAGIGTIYRAEILFLQGIHPRNPVGTVPDLRRLCERVRKLMIANRERAGQVTTGDRRPGRNLWVYGRTGRPCRRCGTLIRVEEFGPDQQERLSYWCPSCQPPRVVRT